MEEKVIEMLKEIIEDDEVQITHETRMMEDLEFSSLELMEIVSEVEEAFGIHVKERELQAIITVGDLIALVGEKTR